MTDVLLFLFVWGSEASAESWCASPLVAHEWGVTQLRGDGRAPTEVPTPAWFGRARAEGTPVGPRVRDLPSDSGHRDLPVVQLYTPDGGANPVPFALEVGFALGEASAWWPPVDALTAEPGRQLVWDALALEGRPGATVRPAEVPWVEVLRAVPGALWVNRGTDSERFVFYEGRTTETSALVLHTGDTWTPARPHYVLENRSPHPVHDVVIVADGRAWTAPQIPAGRSAGFLLDRALDVPRLRAEFEARWVAGEPPSTGVQGGECVMMRDPAVAVERAAGHQLYGPEADALLAVWGDRLFATRGVHLLYREDVAALDAAMPVRLYTDMYHFVDWHRLGLVLVDGLALPEGP